MTRTMLLLSLAHPMALHNPHYDFNDEILPVWAAYWVKLVEMELKA